MLISPPTPSRLVRPAVSFRVLILTVAAVAWAGFSVQADIQLPPKTNRQGDKEVRRQEPPATALPGKARVGLGGSVEIVLSAVGGENRLVEFIIRDAPAHGALAGPPRQLTRTTATVTYVHRAADGPSADGFTFATQVHGGGVSVAAPVAIAVADAAPDLIVTPGELDFGAVKIGSTSRAEMTVENRGGGVAMGRLSAPPPWEVANPADYQLARGQRQTFAVVFRPDRDDAFAETWRFAGEEGRRSLRLVGTGLGRPSVRPSAAAMIVAEDRPAPISAAIPDTMSQAAAPPDGPGPGPAPTSTPLPVPTPTPAPVPTRVVADSQPVDAPPASDSPITQLDWSSTGAGTLELSWTAPTPAPRSYRVEMRYLLFPTHWKEDMDAGKIVDPDIEWRAYESTPISVDGGRVTTKMHGLQAATVYALRVVVIDGEGRATGPSPVAFAQTQVASKSWGITPVRVLLVLLAGVLAFYVHYRWQVRRAFAG